MAPDRSEWNTGLMAPLHMHPDGKVRHNPPVVLRVVVPASTNGSPSDPDQPVLTGPERDMPDKHSDP